MSQALLEKPEKPKQKSEDKESKEEIVSIKEMEALVIFDRQDETQIMLSACGLVADDSIYEWRDKETGKMFRGISWVGMQTLAQEYGGLYCEKPIFGEGEHPIYGKVYRIMIRAVDLKRKVALWGAYEQPLKMELKDGSFINDKHAFSKGCGKAQRNALAKIIPQHIQKAFIKAWVEKKEKLPSRGNAK